jgi:hypothetical protein
VLKDGVAVEPGAAFQHHKSEMKVSVLQISVIVCYCSTYHTMARGQN